MEKLSDSQAFQDRNLLVRGADMVADKIQYLYGAYDPRHPNKGGKVLDAKKHALTKKVHPVDMNAVGGLRFAMMRHQREASPDR